MKYTLFPKDAFSLLESNKKLKLQKLFSVKELRATRFGASFFPSSFFLCLGSRSDTFLDCATCHASKRQVKDWKFFVCFLLLLYCHSMPFSLQSFDGLFGAAYPE